MVNFKHLSFLLSWIFPTKRDRQIFRNLCNSIENRKYTIKVQENYQKTLKKLSKNNKHNVVFLVNEISKWKYQSLYDAMKNTQNYNPIVALTIADIQKNLDIENKKNIIENNEKFFKNKGIETVIKYDLEENKALSLNDLEPDIVFYQQPYNLPKIQSPEVVSKFAITGYVPYYLPDYRNLELDCEWDFHHKVFRFYVLNEELKQEYETHLKAINEFNGNFKAVGHTMLDLFAQKQNIENKGYVIYAPHWSIAQAGNENNINISTFDQNGLEILEFAKNHPEINWAFKPHPTLKTALKRIGWTDESIENYYNEWEKIALVSYDSDYVDLFLSSKAMITDSGSFLLEYFVTGKPLIHLISESATNMPYKQLNKYFNSFYKVYSNQELEECLSEIILRNQDSKFDERKKLLETSNFSKENAAQNILKDLDCIFKEAV